MRGIHSSMHEDAIKADAELVVKAERKTRSKHLKENEDQPGEAHSKLKKRHNYVSYPTDDNHLGDTVEKEGKTTRKTKIYTLKEQDINIFETGNVHSDNVVNTEAKKSNRVTRQTKKIPENEDLPQNAENVITTEPETIPNGKVKGKKNKKKKSKHSDANENEVINVEVKSVSKKSKKKKKKGKRTDTSSEEIQANGLNRSNVSTDSFHSAAGSPLTEKTIKIKENKKTPERKKNYTTFDKTESVEPSSSNTTFEKRGTPRQSGIKIAIQEKHDTSLTTKKSKDANSTYEKIDLIEPSCSNTTFEKRFTPKRKSSIKHTAPEKDVSLHVNTSKEANSTFVKEDCSEKLNTTFEKDTKRRKSLRSNDSTINSTSVILNSTFEKTLDKKQCKTISLDTTFDKTDPKLNTTFDRTESKNNSAKSSLISSDGTVNLTYDKDDNSRISITSDESKTENIVNTTPLLIESSMDESKISSSKQSIDNLNMSQDKSLKEDSLKPQEAAPVTPLKREGTFTKDSPEVMTKRSSNQTPTKRASLPYPGNTPFHVSRSSTKERSVLNVTRSIEKPTRRSSLAAVAPRQTRVMFCSPVNNPAVVTQQRKKVIKSSLKGSNKSFVFDEKESSARPGVRKRSYTHNDAEDVRAVKRTRLADELQQSVDRLSRPRTSSAAAKLDSTPAKKQATPLKAKSDSKRTKLPDFKALHQKQFDRMESLDECQRRKARRARQLLTPTGGVEVLERSSPRGTTETKADKKDPIKKTDTPTKAPKLPTLESLRPGYTRFGFKMNSDVNPFSIPSNNDNKTKDKPEKPNGLHAKLPPKTPNAVLPTSQDKLQRQPTLPSLNGNTVTRKEVAKQAVMREKSFTSLSNKRDVKRSETRTIIKGVRTNRRFELQMKMRNID
ncbi:muscle M-line assembly protein unc-89 isoform X2 [Pectinophora gossypiella]|uniref:muscle M-line assembly protein unc-89 isoform X2 n=1 Tax=Pectinophora gossypiella TaxID=13191 RepID=UPI00214EF569|nr:muscle M-line assembly protein unc-89 isoform X2 [Pectinophora gossypiella]